ncbi:MAG: hypothetical protein QGI63_09800 [Rhodospirillales bacterium]|mgnify:CR=1 FL=1|jgi:hypothetical protein|nr:hypothetical protein [Rhodospirillales bacterium]MDP6774553.1 hypothetical protein [Rhodospirillales bacterium]
MSFAQRVFPNLALAVIALVGLTAIARAGEIKYPPYPEIWGRVFPVPQELAHTTSTRIFDNPDGDRLIRFVFDRKPSLRGGDHFDWWTLTFFGGELRNIDAAESDRITRHYWDTGRGYKHSEVDKIFFANGDVIQDGTREFGGSRCGSNYTYTVEKLNRAGKVLLSKMLFLLHSAPIRRDIWSACFIAGDVGHYTSYADAEFPVFVPLEDSTFLLQTYNERFVIRFKPDLTSPFIDNERLFLVDTAVIDRLVEEAYARPGQAIQNANDAIRDYLLKLSKGE